MVMQNANLLVYIGYQYMSIFPVFNTTADWQLLSGTGGNVKVVWTNDLSSNSGWLVALDNLNLGNTIQWWGQLIQNLLYLGSITT